MSYVIIPYTKNVIPPRENSLGKVVYSPFLETFLMHQDRQTNFSFFSLVDSGADFCVFPAKYGELIGLDVKSGQLVSSFGVGGRETLYFFNIKVEVLVKKDPLRFSCSAGFSYKMNPTGRGLLGRKGFFDLFSEVAFNQEKKLFRLKDKVD